ncbi:hypothetical protein AB0E69_33155 [Kribbella sp. NPDC026611]
MSDPCPASGVIGSMARELTDQEHLVLLNALQQAARFWRSGMRRGGR